jgi:bifunctional non-homologous end joining protein LigD
VERARRVAPVQLLLFDLLEVEGESVVTLPYAERRRRLERLLSPEPGIEAPPAVGCGTGDDLPGVVEQALATSRALGLEGLVLKRTDSRYRPGRRSGDWLKVKHERTQEVVVGGWRPGNGRRSGGVGSLLVGLPTPEGLAYVGRVGTGFSDEALLAIGDRLAERASDRDPFLDVPGADARDAHWVVPDLVAEVRFAEWTGGGRLRQPSWRGWRPDKRPEDVVREPEARVAAQG